MYLKKGASVWGSVLFSDNDETNCMSTGKVCIKTGVMTNIQEDILVVIEGREYQVHVKEIAP